jgi:O-antigen ligase
MVNIAEAKRAKAVIVRGGRSQPNYLSTTVHGVASQQSRLVRWSFLLFIASISCDVWSSAKLGGFLFFAIYFSYNNPFLSKRSFPAVPRNLKWFVVYVAVYSLNVLVLPGEHLTAFFTRLFTLLQAIIFFWIASDILREEKMAEEALVAFSIASVILALGLVFSLPGFFVDGEVGIDRASALGANANSLAGRMGLAMLMLLGLWFSHSQKSCIRNVLMFGSMLILSLATVYTGSRGGVVMLIVGLSVYLFPYWKSRWRLSSVIIGVIAIGGLGSIAMMTPVFHSRWVEFYEGKESTRDRIYEEALVMIAERPLLGWQPIEFWYELGSRTGTSGIRDAHNIYLHLLLEVGAVGAIPFLIGLWLCGRSAWKARHQKFGLLPSAIFLATLAEGMSLTWIYQKPEWFVFAVAIAVTADKKRSSAILISRPMEAGLKGSLKSSPSIPGRDV